MKSVDLINITVIVLFVCFVSVMSQVTARSDNRCKCVCPSQKTFNGTELKKKIYVGDVVASECKCEYIVKPLPEKYLEFCPLCECKYEVRNTTTIKVVVIFIICVVSLLFAYMLFLLGLDPMMQRHRTKYSAQMDEEDDQSVTQVPRERPRPRTFDRQSSIINRVTAQQKKWKGVVEEQRQCVYDSHTMLN